MSENEMKELAALRAENAKLKAVQMAGLSLKVAPKGGISLHGVQGFPVTLKYEQWIKVFEMKEAVAEFYRANKATIEHNLANPRESTMKVRAVG